ncbi:MAG: hypothetical protein QM727_09875 [Niabella sp.]
MPEKSYHFPIPNTKLKLYQFMAYGIVLVNLIVQLYQDYMMGTNRYHLFTILVSIALLFVVGRDAYLTKKNKPLTPIGLLIIIIAVRWFRFHNYWAFFANMALWLLYVIARRNMEISISESHISYPSFPKKNFNWQELSNVILKDGLLTIDCKNNKIYQHYVENSETLANEAEFNEFCHRQITK